MDDATVSPAAAAAAAATNTGGGDGGRRRRRPLRYRLSVRRSSTANNKKGTTRATMTTAITRRICKHFVVSSSSSLLMMILIFLMLIGVLLSRLQQATCFLLPLASAAGASSSSFSSSSSSSSPLLSLSQEQEHQQQDGPDSINIDPPSTSLQHQQRQQGRHSIRVVSINKNNGRKQVTELPLSADSATATTTTDSGDSKIGFGLGFPSARFSARRRRREQRTARRKMISLQSLRSFPSLVTSTLNGTIDRSKRMVGNVVRSTFLPTGYPETVPPNFVSYSVWSCAQDLTTQLRGVLATQRILEGVGVGRQGATTLSALFNYLVRDGCGMVATLLFTYTSSSKFSADIKRWRILADCSVDVGITLELISTILPNQLFLPAICIGNVFKAICGVAAGASGGAINLFWSSRGSSIAEMSAKFGAQHTVTGALGLLFAGLFAKYMHMSSHTTLWILYGILTAFHIFANVRCMRLVSFNDFNIVRIDMVLQHYLQSYSLSQSGDSNPCHKILSPVEVAKDEPLWFLTPKLPLSNKNKAVHKCPIHFGVSFYDFYCRTDKSINELKSLFVKTVNQASEDDRYVISTGSDRKSVVVCFLENSTPVTKTKAYFHSFLLSQEMQNISSRDGPTNIAKIEQSARHNRDLMWSDWSDLAKHAGWNIGNSELQTRGYEISELDFVS